MINYKLNCIRLLNICKLCLFHDWNSITRIEPISSRYEKEYRKLLQSDNYVSLGFNSSVRAFAKTTGDESSRVSKYWNINSIFFSSRFLCKPLYLVAKSSFIDRPRGNSPSRASFECLKPILFLKYVVK